MVEAVDKARRELQAGGTGRGRNCQRDRGLEQGTMEERLEELPGLKGENKHKQSERKIRVSKAISCVKNLSVYMNIYQGLVKSDSVQNAVCGELL